MQPTPLRPSPLQVITQEFISVYVKAQQGNEFGPGNIHVEREVKLLDEDLNRWAVYLNISIDTVKDEPSSPYCGQLVVRGEYQVEDTYAHDPEPLLRITGASMLYGAARELFAQITARGPNGLLTLPSVSFYEPTRRPSPAKKNTARKAPAKRKPTL